MANPFVELKDVPKNELPEFREYAFDFSKDEFIVENGRLAIVTQKEAIKVWAYKALITERYRYRAYFDDYGAELEHFVAPLLMTAPKLLRYSATLRRHCLSIHTLPTSMS